MRIWQDIESAPVDGREVWVKRVYEGRVVSEGWAVFDYLAAEAPSRRGLGLDPLNRLSAADYAREDHQRETYAGRKHWLKPDRIYRFPEPTHWDQNVTNAPSPESVEI